MVVGGPHQLGFGGPGGWIFVDEPELHLHKSIQASLWTAIEAVRSDCLFVYLTHDTEFAAAFPQAKKIWLKNFDGKVWEWEEAQPVEGFRKAAAQAVFRNQFRHPVS